MKSEILRLTKVAHDINGNPRYVAHFLQLNTRAELDASPWIDVSDKYELALHRARKIGGRKFHNKQFGGGIVFQSYSIDELARHVSEVTGRKFTSRLF